MKDDILARARTLHLAGQLAEARLLYLEVLNSQPDNAEVHYALGMLAGQVGRPDVSVWRLQEAIAHQPDFIEAHNSLGLLMQRQGDPEAALAHYQKAISLNPDYADAHNNLGTLYREMGHFDEAVDHYERALALGPSLQAQTNLAAILERANRPEAAREAAENALGLDPNEPGARLVLAKVRQNLGDAEGARRDYERLIATLDGATQASHILTAARAHADLAQIVEKSGDFDHAMALFEAGNSLNCRADALWRRDTEDYLAWVETHSRMLDTLKRTAWRPSPSPGDRAPPIFLVGFPRSGTTLLDQALATLPSVVVLQEKTILDKLRADLEGKEESHLDGLMALSTDELSAMRRKYWAAAERHIGEPIAGRQLVDKMPLNILNLWLIHGLFPKARIVVSLRDPRDVCLSCFTTLFRLRAGVASFPTLEHSVELYCEVMGLWLKQRDLMALNAITLRYEDLVENFEPEMRQLLGFLGLEWDDAVLEYAKAARGRYIATPSYSQVVQPLYRSSIGRWRNYAKHLAPFLAKLRPLMKELGYT